MQKFQVLAAPVTLHSGLVALTEKQHSIRAHCLKKTSQNGVYEILQPFQLKSGEVFGHDGKLSKSVASLLEPIPVAEVKKPETTVNVVTEEVEQSGPDDDGEEGDPNPLSVAALQAQINLGFMKVKAFLKELNVDVEDNEAVLTQEVFDQVVAKVTAAEGNSDEI